MKHSIPQINDRFGRLTVVGEPIRIRITTGTRPQSRTQLPVRCDCGIEFSVGKIDLIRKHTTQCLKCSYLNARGIHKEDSRARARKICPYHCDRLFNKVKNAIQRCTNSKHHWYPRYGGRGICIFPEWLEDKFKFLEYLTTLPGWDNPKLLLDRKNNDGNYEPGNLRFVTAEDSVYNSSMCL